MTDEEEVREVNRGFYLALSSLDMDAMDRIWLHEPWVCCVHPGWSGLRGWEEIRESWERIFSNTVSQTVEESWVSVRVVGEMAWVACQEQVSTPPEAGGMVSFAVSNNLFVKTTSGWKMILHHASPVPVELPTSPSAKVH